MKKVYFSFVIICLLILVIPFAGMITDKPDSVSESGESVELPKTHTKDGKINKYYLSELGDYFTANFAYRDEMVSANAYIYGNIFNTSATDQVLLGENGWMYYTSTLNDYTSTHLMTERGLNNAVHNLSLIQSYVEGMGSEFIFTIAPNKNSLYDDNMPYYYVEGQAENNYERFHAKLEAAGINYVDLFDALSKEDETLYFKQDSHWNNRGAATAFEEIMSHTDMDYENYRDMDYEIVKDHIGDLAKMIYPLNSKPEEDYYYNKNWQYSYVGEHSDDMDSWIVTQSPKNDKTLLMYRDSFGEAILKFFADEFGTAYFSRLVPYNLNNVARRAPDYVIIERVERRLSSFAESAAIMDMPEQNVDTDEGETIWADTELKGLLDSDEVAVTDIGNIEIKESGDYYLIRGDISAEYMTDTSDIYIGFVSSEGNVIYYDTFWVSKEAEEGINDYGYAVYFLKDKLQENVTDIRILVK